MDKPKLPLRKDLLLEAITASSKTLLIYGEGNPRELMAKVMNCSLKISEFELPSRYYVHLLYKYSGEKNDPLISPASS